MEIGEDLRISIVQLFLTGGVSGWDQGDTVKEGDG
jgi:hypothetical protein